MKVLIFWAFFLGFFYMLFYKCNPPAPDLNASKQYKYAKASFMLRQFGYSNQEILAILQN